MADSDCRLHQFRRLAKIGFAAGRVDQGVDFAATNDRPGEDGVAQFTGGGHEIAGQADWSTDIVAVQQARVGPHDVAQAQANGIAGTSSRAARLTHFPSRLTLALIASVAFSAAMALLAYAPPKSDHGVGKKQKQDDPKSGECRAAADRITAASIIQGIGPQK